MDDAAPFRVGWEEWVGLPDLGLPAHEGQGRHRRPDLGAARLRHRALRPGAPRPRCASRAPDPGAHGPLHPLLGRRSSTGARSRARTARPSCATSSAPTSRSAIARWPIEITLTDRGAMTYRMLLGRQALGEDVVVTPARKLLPAAARLRGLLTRPRARERAVAGAAHRRAQPRGAQLFHPPLVAEGERRGHVVEVIDTARCYMAINALAPEVHYDGKRLPRYDAVIPRIGASSPPTAPPSSASSRPSGTYCVNGSDGITASRDKLHAHQILARHRIGMPTTAFANSPKDTDNLIGLVGKRAADREAAGIRRKARASCWPRRRRRRNR